MADDMESVLRNALDAVDRGRRWAILGTVALFAGAAFALFALFHTAAAAPREASPGVASKAVYVLVVFHLLFIACCTAAVMIHVTRMTKSVLQAIDSLKRR